MTLKDIYIILAGAMTPIVIILAFGGLAYGFDIHGTLSTKFWSGFWVCISLIILSAVIINILPEP